MPRYTFTCSTCGKSNQFFTSVSQKQRDCDCGEQMKRELPTLMGTKTTEVVDKYSNKKHVDNQASVLRDRKLIYYWEHEVPKMVNSGIYSVETMLQQGWVYYNEKGDMVTRTKPPHKE